MKEERWNLRIGFKTVVSIRRKSIAMDSKWKTIMTIFIIHGLIIENTTGSAPTRVIGCQEGGFTPTITMECDPGSTILITKGVCVKVPSCNDYDPSLESQCDNSDKTAQWAPYCETVNPCSISGACRTGATCPGESTYIYAEYTCISSGTTEATTSGPTCTSQAPVSDPVPLQADVVTQKGSLFKQIQGKRLRNHVIKTKHGLSLVRCGAECNQRDDCVSFNIGNGVCELNNRVVGGTGVSRDDFVEDEGFKYYEKQ